mmetsp:Transcript_17221/g.58892  ORF Transcript_17221/g.58892 Transcript_17221/m.58892 type:complete len:651 (+) Transcript_17221:560-2512(+)
MATLMSAMEGAHTGAKRCRRPPCQAPARRVCSRSAAPRPAAVAACSGRRRARCRTAVRAVEGRLGAGDTTGEPEEGPVVNKKDCKGDAVSQQELSMFVSPIRPRPTSSPRRWRTGECEEEEEEEERGESLGAPTAELSREPSPAGGGAPKAEGPEGVAVATVEAPPAAPLVQPPAPPESLSRRRRLREMKDTLIGGEELKEVGALALPALGSLLADPLMSLIDTSCVGNYSSVALAALGPNTAVYNFVFQVFTFLSITTTSNIARTVNEEDGDEKMKRHLMNAIVIAFGCGLAACAFMEAAAPLLLGAVGAKGELLAAALPYFRVRTLAVPAVLCCTCMQGACLGRQDARTPLLIFLLAGCINVVGDLALILPSGANMGIRGAAVATAGAQYVAMALFFLVLRRRGLLPASLSEWRLPTKAEVVGYMNVSSMLLLGSLCRMGVYTMMTIAATTCGVIVTACHQIALQVFWTVTYFVDPLFVAATSFIARDHKRRPGRALRMASLLVGLATAVGLALGVVTTTVALLGAQLFTNDALVLGELHSVASLLGWSQVLSAVVLVAEGILIGCGDLRYLLYMHILNFGLLGVFLYAAMQCHLGIAGIWGGVLLNQGLRLAEHAVRVLSPGSPLPVLALLRGEEPKAKVPSKGACA